MTSTKPDFVLAAALAFVCGASPSLAAGVANAPPPATKSTVGATAGLPSPAVVRGTQQLRGHLRPQFTTAPLVGALALATPLHLALGLPVRNAAELNALVRGVSDPHSRQYRHYLTPAQFAERFGPTSQQYAAVIAFAKSNGMKVTKTYANRLVVSVATDSATAEKAFHVALQTRRRPDSSLFYAPDREPSVNLTVPLLHVMGLDNYIRPRPMLVTMPIDRNGNVIQKKGAQPHATLKVLPMPQGHFAPTIGSGPGGLFGGKDFRNAYAAGVARAGAGQTVGLLEFDGFFPGDVAKYFAMPDAPVQHVPVRTVLLDGFDGSPGGANDEVALDIDMAIDMAPRLDAVEVYEGTNTNSVLAAMASPPPGTPLSAQLSASWTYDVDDTSQQLVDEMAVQGQSFFNSSGDDGAFPGNTGDDRDMGNITLVGGTELSVNGTGGSWSSETAWPGSGGGIQSTLIPGYQQGLANASNDGSNDRANVPDVAMVASGIFLFANNGSLLSGSGTSISTPLWAGYIALSNQEAQTRGVGPAGFINPAVYAIGKNAAQFAKDFHDITSGDNGKFNAVTGYDLVTGWGSPTSALFADLNPRAPKPAGFSKLQFQIFTGSDDLRPDSDLEVNFNGIGGFTPLCLMRSNNGDPMGACTGSNAGDQHGTKGWPSWSTQVLTFTNKSASWIPSGSGTMALRIGSHNNGAETNDNWDIQAISVTLSNPDTGKFLTLFSEGHFGSPHDSGHCYWRFKPSGSPPRDSHTYKLLPGNTPSNGCHND